MIFLLCRNGWVRKPRIAYDWVLRANGGPSHKQYGVLNELTNFFEDTVELIQVVILDKELAFAAGAMLNGYFSAEFV